MAERYGAARCGWPFDEVTRSEIRMGSLRPGKRGLGRRHAGGFSEQAMRTVCGRAGLESRLGLGRAPVWRRPAPPSHWHAAPGVWAHRHHHAPQQAVAAAHRWSSLPVPGASSPAPDAVARGLRARSNSALRLASVLRVRLSCASRSMAILALRQSDSLLRCAPPS